MWEGVAGIIFWFRESGPPGWQELREMGPTSRKTLILRILTPQKGNQDLTLYMVGSCYSPIVLWEDVAGIIFWFGESGPPG